MTVLVFFALVGLGVAVALLDWRKGLLCMMVAGVLQDPVRKIMPDSPSWMVLAFLPIWIAISGRVLFGKTAGWQRFANSFPLLLNRVRFFFGTLLIAYLVLIAKHGPEVWKVGLIGLIGYTFPLLMVAIGFLYTREEKPLGGLIVFYCLLMALFLVGGLLEYTGAFQGWRALGTEALGMRWLRHVPGYVVPLTSGFSRSPDIMGWYAAMLVMFSLLMAQRARALPGKAFWLGLASWGALILLVSGRNKMIFMPLVYVGTLGLIYLYKGSLNRVISLALATLISVGFFVTLNQRLEVNEVYLDYAEVGSANLVSRVETGGYRSTLETFRQSGLLGEGLGAVSTGARHGGTMGSIRGWQESGIPKLLVELGVLGLTATMLLGFALFRLVFHFLKVMRRDSSEFVFFAGILAILSANLASFIVSHQVFGDPFIVILVGLLLGILLSIPGWPSVRRTAHSAERPFSDGASTAAD